jgi:predicted RNA-binding Zn ribbon-like protein
LVPVGKRLAVELLNTVIVVDGEPRELLADWRALVAWAGSIGAVRRGELGSRGPAGEPARLRRLREGLRSGLLEWARRGRPPARLVRLLNRHLRRDARRAVLAVGRGAPRIIWRSTAGPLERLYAAVASSAAELIVSGRPERLRKCASQECRIMFYDVSKGARRRWCSMRSCGTREKVRAHYWRHRTLVPTGVR